MEIKILKGLIKLYHDQGIGDMTGLVRGIQPFSVCHNLAVLGVIGYLHFQLEKQFMIMQNTAEEGAQLICDPLKHLLQTARRKAFSSFQGF